MAEVLLKVPEDIRAQLESVMGRKLSSAEWERLFSKFLNEELRTKLETIKRVEGIVSRSRMTQAQADELADKASLALSKRYLSESGVKYSPKKKRGA